MNIWDSVQRGLEKATQEATRIARTQRLRSNADKLTQQIHTQEDSLIARAMEVFAAGQLTQSELIPICQELMRLRQQLEQTQLELKQIQTQGIQQIQPGTGAQPSVLAGPYSHESDLSPTVYVPPPPPPPDYTPYDHTVPALTPPPPPGVEPLTVSSFETIRVANPGGEIQLCQHCRAELIPGNAYCHNCGTAVQNDNVAYQPTVRSEAEQETTRANIDTPSIPIAEQETIRGDLPSSDTIETNGSDSVSHSD